METISFKQFIDFADDITDIHELFPEIKNSNNVNHFQKEDQTPVTDLDLSIEQHIRNKIKLHYPTHAISGEEYSDLDGSGLYSWIIDPIDGTFSYTKNVPLFGTLLGLQFDNKPLYGALRLPLISNKLIAGDGNCIVPKINNKEQVGPGLLCDSLVLTTDSKTINNSPYKEPWDKLCLASGHYRTWGDCFGYYLVCTGGAQVMFDVGLKKCDILPLIPIILGSGCRILELKAPFIDIVVYRKELHTEIINFF
jgi:myo-inositol-1(or 4)-monophosphatase